MLAKSTNEVDIINRRQVSAGPDDEAKPRGLDRRLSGPAKCWTPVLAALILSASAAAPAWAQSYWTSLASAGVVDEADLGEVSLNWGAAEISSLAPANSTVVLWYNITATSDLDNGGVNKWLEARFRDNGSNSRVQLYLRQYSFTSGTITTLLTLDSNARPASNVYQNHEVTDGCWKTSFDFRQNAYYIEAVLSRTSASGLPALALLRVGDRDLC